MVTEVLKTERGLWINVGNGKPGDVNHCAVLVEQNAQSIQIKPGDSLWWQGRSAYWTPQTYTGKRCGGRADGLGTAWDIKIPKIGYSGVPHPAKGLVESAFAC